MIRYEPVISGSVTPGAIHGLRGVSVHILLDILVTDVVVTGDEVTFTAGIINKTLPTAKLAHSPTCVAHLGR